MIDNTRNQSGSAVASSADMHKEYLPKFSTCNKCIMCKQSHFNNNSTFKSFVTGKSFAVPKKSYSCRTSNVIYLISCTKCSIQYVGMTTQQINIRFRQHHSKVKQHSLNTILVNHFNSSDHHYGHLSIQIIDFVEDTDYWIRKHIG